MLEAIELLYFCTYCTPAVSGFDFILVLPSLPFVFRLRVCKPPTETPLPLLRPLTEDEQQARVSKSKREVQKAKVKCGASAALELREEQLAADGLETAAAKKKKKQGTAQQEAMKVMKGGHHLLK